MGYNRPLKVGINHTKVVVV